ncbi:hypothetical protein [Actinoplanes derwentensis]|uniref:YbaB/EbfC DNA-binding family protein n=1 Tax=Actinoplanes derwentensis TaxID=113562 RepID=A0A1H2DDR3_9ACTN|nr:hypothetical protein [Actinoplanes derwentensis]GID84872.1 hypothetical protein Ade03nite_37960 [Actinoplanes derwentensis]SDT80898.1 hypothetical protein SAMN04489716_9409 [Actinoplanes derwentensis]
MSSQTWPEGLQRLHQQVDRLGVLAGELTAAIPQRSEGNDPTGAVSVVLGSAGLPLEIRVRGGWDRRIEPEALGAAVMGACNDAVRQAMRAWTDRLDDDRWWRRQRDAEDEPYAGPVPYALPPGGRVQVDAEFSEPILQALHTAGSRAGEPPASVEGRYDGRNVIVRLGAGGLAGCEIDPGWARRRDGATITAALGGALADARSQVAEPGRQAPTGVDAALHDALATLADLAGQVPNRGERT